MTKEEALWVAIRAVGLVFLVLSIVYFAKVALSGIYYLYITDFALFLDDANMYEITKGEKLAQQTVNKILFDNVIHFILYGISSVYFLCKGSFIHRAISK